MRLLVLFCLLFTQGAYSTSLNESQKLSDFNQLVYSVESGYGPLKYKSQIGIDLNALKLKYTDKIKESKSNAEFYYLLKQFISEFHDGHFRSQLPTDLVAEVPVMTDYIEGKVLIDTIDREKLSEKDFPFKKGDEIVTVNGKPVADEINNLSSYMGSGFSLTEKRRAAMFIFYRPAKTVPVPVEKTIKVGIRHGMTNNIEDVELTWKVTGSYFDEKIENSFLPLASKYKMTDLYVDPELSASPWRAEKSYSCSGKTRIAVPKGATKIIDEPFVAYYHSTPLGNIGYLRIPHYYWKKDEYNELQNENFANKVFDQYEYAIKKLEENTVGLVIDQDHNCGGSVSWLERIVSLFVDKPFKPLQFKFMASKSFYLEIKNYEKQVTPNTFEELAFKELLSLVKTSWERGDFLTPMSSFRGSALVSPHHIRYSKPILVLIDEMSGSGGDAFPSMMKGFGRAKLLGTRTMGLGGHVTPIPDLNYSGLKISMTKSLFYRPDGIEVENNGAVPDYTYSPTREDFMNDYRDYQKYYLEKLSEIISSK